jgi:8-oxo-dGTP pyrophosphatase MutT (NUDIX family)/CTP:molybdopterin cytidylyltransferase MocA
LLLMVTALLMAGGAGERLQRSLGFGPKPLLPVRGVPLIERNLLMLFGAGFRDIVVSVPAGVPSLRGYLLGRGQLLARAVGAQLRILEEQKPLGTIGCAAVVQRRTDNVLVTNADNLTALDYNVMLAQHQKSGAPLTLAVHRETYTIPHGEVVVEAGQVRSYREKPSRSILIASAASILSTQALDLLRANEPAGLPDLVNAMLERGLAVRAYEHNAPWVDVNDGAALKRAEELVSQHSQSFECWSPSPHLHVVGAMLWSHRGILLERRSTSARCHPGLWDLPGGKVEAGERPADALRRELHEELGICSHREKAISVFDDVDTSSGLVLRHHVFSMLVDPGAVEPQTGMVVSWFDPEKIAKLDGLNPIVTRAFAAIDLASPPCTST